MTGLPAVKRLLGVALILGTMVVSAQPPTPPSFENHLRRAVTIKGQPVETFRLADRMAHHKVRGLSVAVVEGCKIASARGFGVIENGGAAVKADTLFQAASISKPVAALAALRLVEQRKLNLDADVRTQLKGWTLPDSELLREHPVTLRGLLSHGAGLTVHGFGGYPAGSPVPTTLQILDGKPPANSDPIRVEAVPGLKWDYSGGGYVVAQLLMTEVAAKPFPELMRELVLAPAKMTSSTYQQPLPTELASVAAVAHDAKGEPLSTRWNVYPEMAAAGLWTTPTDLARFAIEVVRAERGEPGALISRAIAKEMLKTQIGSWGLGLSISAEGKPRSFSHGGANEGYRTMLVMYPDTCQGAAVMLNSDNGLLIEEVLRALADTYAWPDPRSSLQQETVAMSSAIVARFRGKYRLDAVPDYQFEIKTNDQDGLVFIDPNGIAQSLLAASATHLFSPESGMKIEIDSAGASLHVLKISLSGQSYTAARIGS